MTGDLVRQAGTDLGASAGPVHDYLSRNSRTALANPAWGEPGMANCKSGSCTAFGCRQRGRQLLVEPDRADGLGQQQPTGL
jgi:hypothetical protein